MTVRGELTISDVTQEKRSTVPLRTKAPNADAAGAIKRGLFGVEENNTSCSQRGKNRSMSFSRGGRKVQCSNKKSLTGR